MDGERKPVKSFEDLDVFQRAYALSLTVHKLRSIFRKLNSSDWRSKSGARASRSAPTSLRGLASRETQARSSNVSADGDRILRRDASLDPLLQRPRIHRRTRLRGVVRRLRNWPRCSAVFIETGNRKKLFRLLVSGLWLLHARLRRAGDVVPFV